MAHSIKSSWSFQAYDATQRNKKKKQFYLIAKKVLCHLLFRQFINRNILSSSEEAEQRVQRRHFWITRQAKRKNKKQKKQFQILARIKFASMTSLHNWSNRCVTHTHRHTPGMLPAGSEYCKVSIFNFHYLVTLRRGVLTELGWKWLHPWLNYLPWQHIPCSKVGAENIKKKKRKICHDHLCKNFTVVPSSPTAASST